MTCGWLIPKPITGETSPPHKVGGSVYRFGVACANGLISPALWKQPNQAYSYQIASYC
jgi:hypothetical protein